MRWFPFICCTWILLAATGSFERTEASEAPVRSSASITSEASAEPVGDTAGRAAPQKAYDLLLQLQQRNGEPPAGYVGGRAFHNRERRLPGGRYREYDVNPKVRGRPRDAERLVIEQNTGKAYYTDDHYRTFIPLE